MTFEERIQYTLLSSERAAELLEDVDTTLNSPKDVEEKVQEALKELADIKSYAEELQSDYEYIKNILL